MKEFDYKQRPQTKEYNDNYSLIDWKKKSPLSSELNPPLPVRKRGRLTLSPPRFF
jgi:hypothetical protein